MKTIQPVTSWYNGVEKKATVLSACASTDNLSSAASFSYQLYFISDVSTGMTNELEQVASGVLSMSGEDYNNWQTNDYAYNWVAEQLNLTITGEYVPSIV